MIDPLGPLTGNNELVGWLNRLRIAVLARTPRRGRGLKLREDTQGFTYDAEPGGATGSTTAPGMQYRGVWSSSPPSPYMVSNVVVIQTGPAKGLYISLADNNTNAPDTGINWVQLADNNSVGTWA